MLAVDLLDTHTALYVRPHNTVLVYIDQYLVMVYFKP